MSKSESLNSHRKITISKLDAARRQLQAAIKLWFDDGDEVAVHALSYAAYEVIHAVSKKRNPNREPLIFDNTIVHEDSRSAFNKAIKRYGNFFKHADRDDDGVIEFWPDLTKFFIGFAIKGVSQCGERLSIEELAFMCWTTIHEPDSLSEEGAKQLERNNSAEDLRELRSMDKKSFLAGHRSGRIKFTL